MPPESFVIKNIKVGDGKSEKRGNSIARKGKKRGM